MLFECGDEPWVFKVGLWVGGDAGLDGVFGLGECGVDGEVATGAVAVYEGVSVIGGDVGGEGGGEGRRAEPGPEIGNVGDHFWGGGFGEETVVGEDKDSGILTARVMRY